MSTREHLLVTGAVQGVGFRFWSTRRATALGLTGYARNLVDGRVEIEAQGEPDAVAALRADLEDGGSGRPGSVSEVERRPVDVVEGERGFDAR